MGSVVLVADETVAARRDAVYGLFGARVGAGWVFAAECDTLAVGSVVTLQLPVGGGQAAAGLWTAFGYYQQLPTEENRAFLARYRNMLDDGYVGPRDREDDHEGR